MFFESGVEEFAVPESVLDEVHAYVPAFSTRTGLPQDVLGFLLELLPLTSYAASTYRRTIPEAVRLIGHRDSDDVAPLALALHLDVPLWTNDKDFERTGAFLYTTAQLLAVLFPKRGG